MIPIYRIVVVFFVSVQAVITFMLLKQEEAYYADSITTDSQMTKDTSPVLLTKMDERNEFNIFDSSHLLL
jgi:hypothetical protein